MKLNFYGQEVIEDGNVWHVHIKKPIFGTCVAINNKIINQAIERGKMLKISTTNASEETTPYGWIRKSIKMKKVFRFADRPMILWQGVVGEPQKKDRDEKEAIDMQLRLL